MARPGGGWTVPASSAAQSVSLLLLPGEQERRRPPVRPTNSGKGVAAPRGSHLNREKSCGDTDQVGVGETNKQGVGMGEAVDQERGWRSGGKQEQVGGRGEMEQVTGDGVGSWGWMARGSGKGAGIWAGEEKMGANFILIALCFFSLAFTKAVGSKRGTRPPRTGWGWGVERRGGWSHRITPPQF